ncbi:MAG TPA: polymer-forming cytoskeletal protein [Solidesulfovibrio magneticus]|nr:polymer-forming cytoskeletal protein [Solidesulfovibrio magneticus]
MNELTPTTSLKAARGSVIVAVIGALIVMGVLAAAIQKQFGSSSSSMVTENRTDSAGYAAYSGLTFAAAQTEAVLDNLHSSGATTYTLTSGVTFNITVGAKTSGSGTATYPVTVVGTANAGTGYESNAYMSAPVTITVSGGSTNKKPPISGPTVKVAGYVDGDILAENVTLQGGSTVEGSITSTSTTTSLVITGGVNVGGTGEVICSNSSITVSGGSQVVNGTLYSQGDVTIDGGATVNGDIYAKGSVTVSGGAKVNGNIHSLSSVSLTSANIGSSSVKRYIYAAGTVTATGGSTIYVDIHSQTNIALQNITVYGNMYAKTGVTTQQYLTHLYGNSYTNPTAPTAPVACATYTAPTSPTFTASTPRNITSQTTITAGNYYYTSFSTNWIDLCLDVSGGDINIFVSGNASSNATIYVKTSTSGNCFTNSNKMNSIDETFSAAAAKVFLYTGGTFTLGGGVDWFGTVLASGNIQPAGGSSIIGSLHSINGSVNPNSSWYEIKYVKSNYLSSH